MKKEIKIDQANEANDAKFAEIKSVIDILASSPDPKKEVQMELVNAKIPFVMAASIVSLFHNSDVDLIIKASGELSPGATIIAAAGSPGFRSATCTTKFQLTDKGLKLSSKRPGPDDIGFIEFLSKFCQGKGGKIKDAMKNYGNIYATSATSLGIIDKVSDFKDKYEAKKKAIKEAKRKGPKSKVPEMVDAKPVSPLSDEEHAEVMEKVKNIKTPEEEAGK